MPDNDSGANDFTTVFYSRAYATAACEFDTTRKAGWIAESLSRRPIAGIRLVEPVPLTADELERAHAGEYVAAVRTGVPRALAESSGLTWDPGIWTAVCASNGGLVTAVTEAMRTRRNTGSLSSGLHHARTASGENSGCKGQQTNLKPHIGCNALVGQFEEGRRNCESRGNRENTRIDKARVDSQQLC